MSQHKASSLMTALRFAVRESRGGLSSMRLMIVALVLGVAVISGVVVLRDALFAGIERDAKRVLGGDLVLSRPYKPAGDDERKIISAYGYTSEVAEMRTMAAAGSDKDVRRRLVEIKGVDDSYPLYGEVELEPYIKLDDALKDKGAVVDPSILDLLKLKVGDSIKIGSADFTVRAAIKREPDRVIYSYQLGPRVIVSRESLEATGLLMPGSVVNYHVRLRLKQGEKPAEVRNEVATAVAGKGWRISDYSDAAPRLKDLLDRLQRYVGIVALAVLLTAGMGIAISVRTWLAKRQQTIAVLKCLGTNSTVVGMVYGVLLLAVTMLAAITGLAGGYLLPRWLLPLMSGVIPVDPVWAFDVKSLLPVPFFALALVATFGFWPLAEAIAIRPAQVFRNANVISDGSSSMKLWQGVVIFVFAMVLVGLAALITKAPLLTVNFSLGVCAASFLLYVLSFAIQWLARTSGAKMGLVGRYAMASLTRIGAPTTAMIFSIGMGAALLVSVLLVENNMTRQLGGSVPDDAPSFFFLDIPSAKHDDFVKMLSDMEGVTSYKDVPVMRGRLTGIKGAAVEHADIAQDVEWAVQGDRVLAFADSKPDNQLVAGEWWQAGEDKPVVSITKDMAEGMGLAVGDALTFDIMGEKVEVKIASIRDVDWRSMRMNFAFIFPEHMIGSRPYSYMATVKSSIAAEANVMRTVGDEYQSVATVRLREALQDANVIVSRIGNVVQAVAAFALLMGVMVMIAAVGASLQRRVLDNALLKVLGATRSLITRMIAVEFMIVGVASAVVSMLLGMVASWLIVHFVLKSQFYLSPAVMLSTSVLSVAGIMLAGILISWKSLGEKPLNVLRNE